MNLPKELKKIFSVISLSKKSGEIFWVAAVIVALVLLQRQLWVTNQLMVSHDSITWYGIFSYFADCLLRGFFPFWNPYMNCGEQFFLNINILHLLDPSTLLLIPIGKIFKIDLLSLYHYDLLMRYIIFACGGYLFFRHVAKHRISAFIAFITLTFSSLSVSYLRQHAFILAFYTLPWILLFIIKLLEERKPEFLLAIAFFLGITLPSYHSMFAIISLTILLLALFFSKGLPRPDFKIFLRKWKISAAALFIFLLLTINLIPLYLRYAYNIVPTLRIFEAPLEARSFPQDFLNLVNPYSFIYHFFDSFFMSESFLYIGLIPLFFVFIGLFFSKQKYKTGFMITAAIVALLMLGDKYLVSRLFSSFFPFFSVIRNTHTFGPFLVFCLVFFVCIGMDAFVDLDGASQIDVYKKGIAFIFILICGLALAANYYIYQAFPTLAKRFPYFITDFTIFFAFPNKSLLYILSDWFYKSAFNLILFLFGGVIIFYFLVNKTKFAGRIKYVLIIIFLSADLLSFNYIAYRFMTIPRADTNVISSGEFIYSDSRLAFIRPKYPFYAFVPAAQKIFTAYSTRVPWITTHIYEMKDYFEFKNNLKIEENTRNILMGISAPKLRLIDKAIILPDEGIINKLKENNLEAAGNVAFINEELPLKYAHLKQSLAATGKESRNNGKIKVTAFGPNEITIDVYADKDAFLYYSQTFDKAWRAFIDNKETKIYKTDLAFTSVIVDKGEHTVRLVYDPKFYKFTLLCYFAGLTALIAILISSGLKHARQKQGI